MRELGTGFIRRWMAWAGMLMGTAVSKEGIGGPTRRRRYLILLVLNLLVIAILGGLAIADLFDAISFYPWMGDRAFVIELATGLAASVIIAALLSIVWWRRWRFPLVFGLILAPLLPALLVTAALSLLYLVLEFLVGLSRLQKKAPHPLEPDQLCN